jgi:hypothetical protein
LGWTLHGQQRVSQNHLKATRWQKADRWQRLPSRPPLITVPAAKVCARRLDFYADIEADAVGSYAGALGGIDGPRYLTAAPASSPHSNRRRHCHFCAHTPTMKLSKWMNKSANGHEAGSSSGRRRRQDSPPRQNPAQSRVIPPQPQPHMFSGLQAPVATQPPPPHQPGRNMRYLPVLEAQRRWAQGDPCRHRAISLPHG